MLLALLQWIQNTSVFVYLRSSAYLYPVILALHLSAISLFGGMIVLTDLCLLGWISPAGVRRGCDRWSPLAEAHRLAGRGNIRPPSILLQSRAVLLQRLLPHQTAAICIGWSSRAGIPKSSLQPARRNDAGWITKSTGAPRGFSVSSAVGRYPHRRQGDRICAGASGPSFPIRLLRDAYVHHTPTKNRAPFHY